MKTLRCNMYKLVPVVKDNMRYDQPIACNIHSKLYLSIIVIDSTMIHPST